MSEPDRDRVLDREPGQHDRVHTVLLPCPRCAEVQTMRGTPGQLRRMRLLTAGLCYRCAAGAPVVSNAGDVVSASRRSGESWVERHAQAGRPRRNGRAV